MASKYIQASAIVRREKYNTHVKIHVDAGTYRVVVEASSHPAKGLWEFCTESQTVVVYDETGEQIAIGHRHERYGRVFTRDGLDPKWVLVLDEDTIYGQ